ncbi:unnamed protein product [Orchesella dallaii]|uniref:Odorant receptor n=1 Tax=Orchesella dallaii TaxID=48710 RepID=A0ABP1Q1U2_9HEXA
MLSKRLLNIMLSYTNCVDKIGSFPFKRDKRSRKIYYTEKRLQFLRYVSLVEGLWIVFMYYQCIRFKLEGNIDDFNLIYTFAVANITTVLVFGINNLFYSDITLVFNSYFQLMYNLQEKYMPASYDPRTSKVMKALEFLTSSTIIIMTILAFLTSLMTIFVQSHPLLPTSLIHPDFKYGIILKMILFPIQMSVPFAVYGALVMIYTLVYSATVIPFFTNELRIGTGQYKTLDSLRTPKNLMATFRSFQLLHQIAMSCFGVFIVPCQTTFSNLILFSNFMFIRHRAELQPETNCMLIGWSTLCLLFWMYVLELGGRLHSRGREVLKSWKFHNFGDKNVNRCMSKFRKSCRPLALNFGRTYVIRRLSVLKFIRGLTVGTFRLLLAVDE